MNTGGYLIFYEMLITLVYVAMEATLLATCKEGKINLLST